MKKNIFIAVLGLSSITGAYGQGRIFFSNYFNSTSPQIRFTSIPALAPPGAAGLTVGSTIRVELAWYLGTSATDIPTSLAQMTLAPSTITPVGLAGGDANGSQYAGWFPAGDPNPFVFQVPGVTTANNMFTSFAILAFSGSSYQSSQYTGTSGIFQSPTQASNISPIPRFVQGSWQNFIVQDVPEPTMLALAALGSLASFMVVRCKKA